MRGSVLLVCAGVLLLGGVAVGDLGGSLTWNGSHDAGLTEAGKNGKPVVIYFTADW